MNIAQAQKMVQDALNRGASGLSRQQSITLLQETIEECQLRLNALRAEQNRDDDANKN